MPQSRGMVKVAPRGTPPLTIIDAIGNAVDWIVDFVPYFIDAYNTMSGTTNEFESRQLADKVQGFWSYIWSQAYIFYVEDLVVTYHGKDTETYRTGTGTQTGVQTNAKIFREYKFKTTISERDWDVVSGMWSETAQNIASRNTSVINLIGGMVEDWWNRQTGYNIAKEYLKKRREFLRKLDGIDLSISSSMFEPADVKMTEYSYQVFPGQQETTYSLAFKEVAALEDVPYDTGMDAIEPGASV